MVNAARVFKSLTSTMPRVSRTCRESVTPCSTFLKLFWRKQVFKTLPLIAADEGRICDRTALFRGQNRNFLVYWARFMPLLIDRHATPRVFKFGQGFAMPGRTLTDPAADGLAINIVGE